MSATYDIICAGMALVDCIIKGFDPEPISASGFRAKSLSLNAGGEAVNEAVTAARLGMKTAIMCSLGLDGAGSLVLDHLEDAFASLSPEKRLERFCYAGDDRNIIARFLDGKEIIL